MKTQADYIIAKLRGEIEPYEEVEYIELQYIGNQFPTAIPVKVIKHPALTCEQWLKEQNSAFMKSHTNKNATLKWQVI